MKLKKIIASLTAAAMAVTTMAFAPLSVSAQTFDPAPSGKETKLASLEFTPPVKLDSYGSQWVQSYDSNLADWLKESDTYIKVAVTDVTYQDKSFDDILGWDLSWLEFMFLDTRNYMPVGDVSAASSVVYAPLSDFSLNEYNGIGFNIQAGHVGFTVQSADIVKVVSQSAVVPTSDVELGTLSGGGEQTTEVASWDPNSLDKNTWSSDFYPAASKAASAAYYSDTADYLKNFAGILYEVNVSSVKTVKYGDLNVQPYGSCANYNWISGEYSTAIENGTDNFYVYMDIAQLLDRVASTTTLAQMGVQLYDKVNFAKAGLTGNVSYTAKATLLLNKPTLSIISAPDLTVGDTAAVDVEIIPDVLASTLKWETDDKTVAEVDKDGKVTGVSAGKATITVTSPVEKSLTDSCEVTVIKNTYAITVKSNNDAYGTASADVKEAAEGTKVTLTAVPKTGYKFVEWKSDDVTITDSTFTMPAKEVEITAVFEEKAPDEFDITVAKATNGTVTVKGGKTASVKDETIDLVITPDKGYEVDTVKVNGEAITGTSFTMPEKDVTIEVTFKKSTYTVTVAAAANGTVTADKATAQMGDTVTVTATPDKDYELSKITVNGTAITGSTFTMPAENVTVTAEFKKVGSAGAEIVVPEGVSVSFAGSKEDILKAVFGDDYAALVAAGYKLDVVMTVKDETAVSAEDKALVEGALSGDMHIGLLIDVSLVMTKDGVSSVVANSSKPVSFVIGVPDSVIADGRTYSVIRVHDGAAEDIGGTYDAANKTITVSSDKYSTYAVVYKDAPAPAPEPQPTVIYYSITADRNVTASASSAAAGEQINVRVDFGYDAYVYCGGRVISKITENGSFTMPAGKVTIVSQANGYLVMIKNAAPNSYIFVYDADMNYIKTNGSVKGIKGEGKVTVKLGEEYAGKTVTLYKGRKSTKVELDSKTLDANGNATFTVEGGKNYTAVVE